MRGVVRIPRDMVYGNQLQSVDIGTTGHVMVLCRHVLCSTQLGSGWGCVVHCVLQLVRARGEPVHSVGTSPDSQCSFQLTT